MQGRRARGRAGNGMLAVCLMTWAGLAAGQPAPDAGPSGVHIAQCWVRALPGSLPSAAYFQIVNDGDDDATLVGVASPAHAVGVLHATRVRDGMAAMTRVEQVRVPARDSLAFAPGGYHVMLERPAAPIRAGARLTLTFRFADAGERRADCKVMPPGYLP